MVACMAFILQMILFTISSIGSKGKDNKEFTYSTTAGHGNQDYAKKICSSLEMSLPKLSRDKDQQVLITLANRLNIKRLWLPWEFVYFESWLWVDGSQYGGKGPMKESSSRICATYRQLEDMVYAADCFVEARGSICQYQDCQRCLGQGCVKQPGNEKRCYKVHNMAITWQKASSVCVKEGGTLLKNMDNLTILKEWIRGRDHWIGLIKAGWQVQEKNGKTNLGSLPISPWKKGVRFKQQNTCSIIHLQGNKTEWLPASCNASEYFFCVKEGAKEESKWMDMYFGKRDKAIITSLSISLSLIFVMLCGVCAKKITHRIKAQRDSRDNDRTSCTNSLKPDRSKKVRRLPPEIHEYSNDDLWDKGPVTSQLPVDYECVAYKNLEMQMHENYELGPADQENRPGDYELLLVRGMHTFPLGQTGPC